MVSLPSLGVSSLDLGRSVHRAAPFLFVGQGHSLPRAHAPPRWAVTQLATAPLLQRSMNHRGPGPSGVVCRLAASAQRGVAAYDCASRTWRAARDLSTRSTARMAPS